ncbi:MAG TPA: hypothetical protein VMF87_29885 [Streptosporangiaceae bacterium]|nr:hypothetical protein [Streptosporangiaceae bacterium]
MTETGKSRAQELFGDTAPELVRLTDDVLFGQVWADPANDLSSGELAAAMTHVAFYAGWPAGMTGVTELKKITEA